MSRTVWIVPALTAALLACVIGAVVCALAAVEHPAFLELVASASVGALAMAWRNEPV